MSRFPTPVRDEHGNVLRNDTGQILIPVWQWLLGWAFIWLVFDVCAAALCVLAVVAFEAVS